MALKGKVVGHGAGFLDGKAVCCAASQSMTTKCRHVYMCMHALAHGWPHVHAHCMGVCTNMHTRAYKIKCNSISSQTPDLLSKPQRISAHKITQPRMHAPCAHLYGCYRLIWLSRACLW